MNFRGPFPPQLLGDFVNSLLLTAAVSYRVLKVYSSTVAARGSHEVLLVINVLKSSQ